MTSLSLSLAGGQVLTAAASTSAEDRVRKFLLVPWGVPGRTNLGPKKVHRGAIQTEWARSQRSLDTSRDLSLYGFQLART